MTKLITRLLIVLSIIAGTSAAMFSVIYSPNALAEGTTLKHEYPVRSELQYIPTGIKYLGSAHPIPDQHAKCMGYLDSLQDRQFARLNQMNDRNALWPKLVQSLQNSSRTIDWGISAKVNYPEWLEELRRDLPDLQKKLENSRAELREHKALERQEISRLASETDPRVRALSAAGLFQLSEGIKAEEDVVR